MLGGSRNWQLCVYRLLFACATLPLALNVKAAEPQLTTVAASYGPGGTPINGVSFGYDFSLSTINDWGEVAFRASEYILGEGYYIPSAWSVSSSGHINRIVNVGTTAPGAEPATFEAFAYLSANALGQSVFYGRLTGEHVAESNAYGIWATSENGQSRLVARSGAPAVGTNKVFHNIYGNSFINQLSFKLSQQGQVAFIAEAIDPSGIESHQYGVWKEDASHELRLVALDNTPVPGFSDGTTFRLMKDFAPLVTDQGHVAFLANSSGPQDDDPWTIGIWREQQDSTFRLAAGATQPVPGWNSTLYLKQIDYFSINNRGDTAFFAVSRPTPEPLPTQWLRGIWLADSNGEKTLVAMEGAPVPGMDSTWFGTWTLMRNNSVGGLDNTMLLNGKGDIVFMAPLSGPDVTEANDTALWYRPANGELSLVAREGDLAPNGNLFGNFIAGATSLSFNDLGQIAFIQPSLDAIWGYNHRGELVLIAESGQQIDVNNGPAVDLRTLGQLNMLTGSGGEDSGRTGFNDRGQIVFYAGLGNFSAGILLSNAMLVPEPDPRGMLLACAMIAIVARRKTPTR